MYLIFVIKKMTSKEDNDINENQIKIMILGNSSVGKTSFIIKCTEDCFQEVYLSTIGIDYKEKEVIIEGKKYKILLYDTTGQERFKSLAINLIKDADGVMLMYDITNRESFNSIIDWIKNIEERKGENFPTIILGNKVDNEDIRKVSKEEGEKVAEGNDISFFEISNKTGVNVNEALLAFIKEILSSKKKNVFLKTQTISIKSLKTKKKKKCC